MLVFASAGLRIMDPGCKTFLKNHYSLMNLMKYGKIVMHKKS